MTTRRCSPCSIEIAFLHQPAHFQQPEQPLPELVTFTSAYRGDMRLDPKPRPNGLGACWHAVQCSATTTSAVAAAL